MRQNKLAWVQALRGAAAFMVVMVHSRSVLMDTAAGKVVANHVLLPMGMGVDLFFIISGFLMVFTSQDFDGTKAYAWRFMAKRAARIWPLFAVVTPVALVVEHGIHGFLDPSILLPYLEGLAFIPHDPSASGIYFQMAVGVAWTLCFECYFYLLFAACMLFGRWRYVAMAAWFALTLVVIPLIRGNYNLNVASQSLVEWSRYANLAINPIVWDFVVGMLGGWLYVSDFKIERIGTIYAMVMVSGLLLSIGWNRLGMVNFFGPHGWAAPMTILFFGAVMLAKIGAINVPAWSVWLGDISYSLYLVHVYVFEILQRVAGAIPMNHDTSNAVLFIIRPVAAVICAWVTFRYVEAPLSTLARKLLGLSNSVRQRKRTHPG
ncbi:acyltransferase family protein [Dyella lipolytica]|uniref:acyltransferase family protein n=1 Tax=Dyella lipolytica TaxID=1867835 RepID=UPI00384B5C4C